jgi:hypothetical protein
MTVRTEQTQNSERIREFVQLLLEAMPKITDPLPEALTQLLNALDELPPKDKPRHITNPTAFIRLCNILHRNTNPTMGGSADAEPPSEGTCGTTARNRRGERGDIRFLASAIPSP